MYFVLKYYDISLSLFAYNVFPPVPADQLADPQGQGIGAECFANIQPPPPRSLLLLLPGPLLPLLMLLLMLMLVLWVLLTLLRLSLGVVSCGW